MEKKEFYSIFGGIFAPKIEFADKFCAKYGYKYISIGRLALEISALVANDNLPKDIDEETKQNLCDFSQMVIHRNEIPSSFMAWVISLHMKRDKENRKFIIDGFPRNAADFYCLDEIEAECKGAICLHIDDVDARKKMIAARENDKIEMYTDKYIKTSIIQYHQINDAIFTKYMIASTIITLDAKEPVDELVEKCFNEIEENQLNDE